MTAPRCLPSGRGSKRVFLSVGRRDPHHQALVPKPLGVSSGIQTEQVVPGGSWGGDPTGLRCHPRQMNEPLGKPGHFRPRAELSLVNKSSQLRAGRANFSGRRYTRSFARRHADCLQAVRGVKAFPGMHSARGWFLGGGDGQKFSLQELCLSQTSHGCPDA